MSRLIKTFKLNYKSGMNGRKTCCLLKPGSAASTHVYRYSCFTSGSELLYGLLVVIPNKYFPHTNGNYVCMFYRICKSSNIYLTAFYL